MPKTQGAILAHALVAIVGRGAEAIEVTLFPLSLPIQGSEGLFEAGAAKAMGITLLFRHTISPLCVAFDTDVFHILNGPYLP